MTKRLAKVYPRLCDMQTIKQAHKETRVGKTSRPEVQLVDNNLE